MESELFCKHVSPTILISLNRDLGKDWFKAMVNLEIFKKLLH